MSDLSLKVLTALFAKSNAASLVGAGKLTKIYHAKADKNSNFPYGIITRIAPGTVNYLFRGKIAKEDDLYLFKVVTDSSLTAGQSPQLFAETLSNSWEALMGSSLTLVGGGTVTWFLRWADFTQDEPDNNSWIYHRGFIKRIVTEP